MFATIQLEEWGVVVWMLFVVASCAGWYWMGFRHGTKKARRGRVIEGVRYKILHLESQEENPGVSKVFLGDP